MERHPSPQGGKIVKRLLGRMRCVAARFRGKQGQAPTRRELTGLSIGQSSSASKAKTPFATESNLYLGGKYVEKLQKRGWKDAGTEKMVKSGGSLAYQKS